MRLRRRAGFGSARSLLRPAALLIPFCLAVSPIFPTTAARADDPTPITTPHLFESSSLFGGAQGIFGLGAKQAPTPGNAPGVPFSEILHGNGTCAGYVLSHGNILPTTLSVHAGGALLHPNQDYWVDALNGSLFFASPVRSFDNVSVSYRYLEGQDDQRQPLSMPGLQLGFGQSTLLGLFYATTPGNGSGIDISTYGMALNSKFGAGGLSTYNGLAYFSAAHKNNNLQLSLHATSAPSPAASPQDTGNDHLIVQNLGLQTGGFRAHLDYQDIGKKFGGFQALKLNNAGNKAMLDQLSQLEGEKGVKRLGFGLGYNPFGKGDAAGGLALDWSQIQDGKGSITQQTAAFTSRAFHLNYATRDIGAGFAQFKGLREGERTDWEHQKGMHTTGLGLGFNFGAGGKGAAPGALDFLTQNFQDKTGSFHRNLWTLNAGNFHLMDLSRHADSAFKRLGDLSEADKTALALDLYRQYDPQATADRVTATDKAQVAKETALSRDALSADLGLGKKGDLAFSELHLKDTTPGSSGGLQRESVSLNTPNLGLQYVSRRTDAKFGRLGDLSDIDKNNLALDIRRQFDPDARLDQVAQKERDQAGKEMGLDRSSLRGYLKLGRFGALNFNDFTIATALADNGGPDLRGAIRRQSFNFLSRTLQLSWLNQSISDSFSRLTDLSDVERAQFGNEHGLARQQLEMLVQLNKATKIGYSSLQIGTTPDALARALAAAKDPADLQTLTRTIVSRLHRESFTLETKGLNLAAHFADTDKSFTRAADLALPDTDKRTIETERGFRRSDYTAHFAMIKGLTVDTSTYSAADALDQLRHQTYKNNLQFTPFKSLALAYASDGDLASANQQTNGLVHTLLTLNQNFGKGMVLSYYQDQTKTFEKSAVTKSVQTEDLHFETAQNKPNAFLFDDKHISFQDGKFENTVNVNIHAKPAKAFAFDYSRLEIDRGGGQEPTDPSENTDSFDFQWQATKQYAMTAGFAQTTTTDAKSDADTVSVGLKGQAFKDVTLDAKFDEVHNNGKNTKDVADFSFCNSKPFTLGPIHELTLTARYASLNDKRKLQNETMTGRATWKLWKNEFILDYGGLTKEDGKSTISRVYSFLTDPNPKKWFHAGFYYKDRTMLDGKEQLIRRFTADARLSKRTHFSYLFGTLPEDEHGNVTPQTTADVSLKHAFRPDLTGQLFYRLSDNQATKILTRSLGFGFEGRLNRMDKLALAYSIDANGFSDRYDHSGHLHLAFDHQVDADHLFSISTEIRSHDGKGLVDEIQSNLDFRTRF